MFCGPPNHLRCLCGQTLDVFGDHILGCRKGHLRSKCHDALRDIIYHCVLTDTKEARIEQRSNRENLKRPGDIFHPDFLEGKPTYFDVLIRNSRLPQFTINSATHAGSAAAAGELEKDDKCDEDVSLSGSSFYPLIAETLGIWSPNSLQILKIIALQSAVTSNLSVTNLHEQLSVCRNAKMLLNQLCLGDLDLTGWAGMRVYSEI